MNDVLALMIEFYPQVLRKAKTYIKKHEGELKQSKQAKDIMANFRVFIEKVI
jgi:hypothetical protein